MIVLYRELTNSFTAMIAHSYLTPKAVWVCIVSRNIRLKLLMMLNPYRWYVNSLKENHSIAAYVTRSSNLGPISKDITSIFTLVSSYLSLLFVLYVIVNLKNLKVLEFI